ncbi:MAG: NAD(P) transhydrogenase subunit alpha [Mycobacteriales bacterium]
MEGLTAGVLRETAEGERRVAITPDAVTRLRGTGLEVVVESGAGERAWWSDTAYADAGARVVSRQDVHADADVLLCVQAPGDLDALRPGQLLIGLLQPVVRPQLARGLARAGVTALSLDLLPRTLSRAQSMDALTSQANVAGYKAALVAADAYGGFFPMLMTAAGTTRPAKVLVLGAGVAGLQALGTARRLGALVTGYDVREAARADVLSLGAGFLDLVPGLSAAATGGYARELTPAEQQAQHEALDAAIGAFDVVIATAQVPGRRPPLLVSSAALAAMRPGSVVVDLAASDLGGNVEGSAPTATRVTDNGVTVIGAGHLASEMPQAASTAYARNLTSLLGQLVRDGALALDRSDEIQAALVVTHGGEVVHPAVKDALARNHEEAVA